MPDKKPFSAKAHTELRRLDGAEDNRLDQNQADVPKLKPRAPKDRLPGGDDDDLFNDMPV